MNKHVSASVLKTAGSCLPFDHAEFACIYHSVYFHQNNPGELQLWRNTQKYKQF